MYSCRICNKSVPNELVYKSSVNHAKFTCICLPCKRAKDKAYRQTDLYKQNSVSRKESLYRWRGVVNYCTLKYGRCSKCNASIVVNKSRKYCYDCKNTKHVHIYSDNCIVCNNLIQNGFGTKWCSKKCYTKQYRASKGIASENHSKRAKRNGGISESVINLKVFQRDKWTCKMCGIKTPRSLMGKHEPNAPRLDHIIPTSKGGSHTYCNVQTLCNKCNRKKSTKIIGQLPLFNTNNKGQIKTY